ncbi:hypothetical protein cyc_02405 [Cyclospora cayetanensis]|uniref:Uncharacterized protein n=1 Tax=Cyclospora cayetanensis TaxID=88456 RepID=A0A1D3D972_9EIME|nr:hypothetical protein cyc_02405 [Cyclospora cayetanensis]
MGARAKDGLQAHSEGKGMGEMQPFRCEKRKALPSTCSQHHAAREASDPRVTAEQDGVLLNFVRIAAIERPRLLPTRCLDPGYGEFESRRELCSFPRNGTHSSELWSAMEAPGILVASCLSASGRWSYMSSEQQSRLQ